MLVHEDSTQYGQKLIERARGLVEETFPPGYDVRYTGTLASTAAATEVMVSGKIRNIGQIAFITWLIASLLLRSALGGLLVVVPLALSVAVNFGAMGLVGLPLDSVTSAISAMAVGIGADYAMYYLFRTREELARGIPLEDAITSALHTSGKAVLFVSTAIASGYATLCFSGFGIHMRLGTLVALAMVTSSVAALLLLPAILAGLRPAFIWGEKAELQARAASDAVPAPQEGRRDAVGGSG
jgi:predicted RND superfamily exporter protein